jgi:hypothetical protein
VEWQGAGQSVNPQTLDGKKKHEPLPRHPRLRESGLILSILPIHVPSTSFFLMPPMDWDKHRYYFVSSVPIGVHPWLKI